MSTSNVKSASRGRSRAIVEGQSKVSSSNDGGTDNREVDNALGALEQVNVGDDKDESYSASKTGYAIEQSPNTDMPNNSKDSLAKKDQAVEGEELEVPEEMKALKDQDSGKVTESDDEMRDESTLPDDIFTMLLLSDYKSTAFAYGMIIFLIQVYILVLIPWNIMHDDNAPEYLTPDSIFAVMNIPTTWSLTVIMSQFVAIALLIILTNCDFTDAIRFLSLRDDVAVKSKFPAATTFKGRLVSVMRLFTAASVVLVSFLFILQASAPIDILINFAAVIFVSELDNLGFQLARRGWLGTEIQQVTIAIAEVKCEGYSKTRPIVVTVLLVILTGIYIPIMICQVRGMVLEEIVCRRLSVTFGDDVYYLPKDNITFDVEIRDNQDCGKGRTNCKFIKDSRRAMDFDTGFAPNIYFSYFSGVYEGHLCSNNERQAYWERGEEDPTSGMFYYCDFEKAWVFTIQAFMDNGVISPKTIGKKGEGCDFGWLMRSPITDAIALEDVSMDGWTLWMNDKQSLASTLSIKCIECHHDRDCGGSLGSCNREKKKCVCPDDRIGHFCSEDAPCEYITQLTSLSDLDKQSNIVFWNRYNDGWIYTAVDNLMAYDRKIYYVLYDGTTLPYEDRVTMFGEADAIRYGTLQGFAVLIYIGSRWLLKDGLGRSWEDFKKVHLYEDENRFHAYWNDILGKAKETNVLSPSRSIATERYCPIGNLEWVGSFESNSAGNFGIFGYHYTLPRRFECYSVNCNIQNVCGSRGSNTCNNNYNLYIPDKPKMQGGKCECSGYYFGFFCEIPCTFTSPCTNTKTEIVERPAGTCKDFYDLLADDCDPLNSESLPSNSCDACPDAQNHTLQYNKEICIRDEKGNNICNNCGAFYEEYLYNGLTASVATCEDAADLLQSTGCCVLPA